MGLLSGSTSAYKSVDRTNFTAVNGQTTFTLTQGYSVGDVDVYLNGVKLLEGDDYYATNGVTVVINSACAEGDFLQVVSYNQFLTSNAYTKTESDSRYMVASGSTPMTSYLRTPNYGVSSWSDSANASLEASVGSGSQGTSVKVHGRSVATFGGDIHYISDTRGAGGGHKFYGWNGTSATNFMNIDSSGRLTIPNQPSFRSESNTYNSTTGIFSAWSTTNTNIGLSTIYRNIGAHFNTVTGTFTTPVTGKYLVTAMYSNGTGTAERNIGWLYYNGTNIGEWVESYGQYDNTHGAMMLWLNVGDTIQFATHPGIPFNSITAGIDLIN